MSNQQMIAPNRLAQATQELSDLQLGKYVIPTEIQEKEKEYYVVVGVKSQDTANRMGKSFQFWTRYYNRNEWNRMERDLKSKAPMFKMMCNDLFNKVVLLHDPTFKPKKKESKKVKQLSPAQKKSVNEAMEAGKGEDKEALMVLAKELGIDIERIEAHLKTF